MRVVYTGQKGHEPGRFREDELLHRQLGINMDSVFQRKDLKGMVLGSVEDGIVPADGSR